jgi:hypothetical protein
VQNGAIDSTLRAMTSHFPSAPLRSSSSLAPQGSTIIDDTYSRSAQLLCLLPRKDHEARPSPWPVRHLVAFTATSLQPLFTDLM